MLFVDFFFNHAVKHFVFLGQCLQIFWISLGVHRLASPPRLAAAATTTSRRRGRSLKIILNHLDARIAIADMCFQMFNTMTTLSTLGLSFVKIISSRPRIFHIFVSRFSFACGPDEVVLETLEEVFNFKVRSRFWKKNKRQS